MLFDLADLSRARVYHLMIQTLVPRPIAWVLSDSGAGRWNVAPFSYFTGISSDPPLLLLSIGHKADGSRKDTWRNIEERDDFVVHVGSPEHADAISATAAPLPHGQSELDVAGLATVPFEGCRLPRLAGPRVAYACRRHRILELGRAPQGVVVGEILRVWVDDAVVEMDGDRPRVDPRRLDPLARLGGDDFGTLGEVTQVPRPR